jgi:hypothetical protein
VKSWGDKIKVTPSGQQDAQDWKVREDCGEIGLTFLLRNASAIAEMEQAMNLNIRMRLATKQGWSPQ